MEVLMLPLLVSSQDSNFRNWLILDRNRVYAGMGYNLIKVLGFKWGI